MRYVGGLSNVDDPYRSETAYEGDLLWNNRGEDEPLFERVSLPHMPQQDWLRYGAALMQVNESWRVVEDPASGKTFEIAYIEASKPSLPGVVLEMSTYTSSLSGNSGNAVEFVENQLASRRSRVYVASFGNGGTSYFDQDELSYLRSTGRYSESLETTSGLSLPRGILSVRALARVLQQEKINITHLSSNSSGFAAGRGLMSELPDGQVEAAYFKSPTNISQRSIGQMVVGMGVIENMVYGKKQSAETNDPLRTNGSDFDFLREEAVAMLPRIYNEEKRGPENNRLLARARSSHRPTKLLNDAYIFGKAERSGDPAIADLKNGFQKQPDAKVTLHMPEDDRLYDRGAETEFLARWKNAARFAMQSPMSNLLILSLEGRHADHTFYPRKRHAAEYFSFED